MESADKICTYNSVAVMVEMICHEGLQSEQNSYGDLKKCSYLILHELVVLRILQILRLSEDVVEQTNRLFEMLFRGLQLLIRLYRLPLVDSARRWVIGIG